MSWETKNNYNAFTVISALQKEIRRGNEEDAMFWAMELSESGGLKTVLNRLRVIAHEDIGTGDMLATLFALRAVDDAERFSSEKKDAWKLCLSNIILSLCKARKSRDADNFQASIRLKIEKEKGGKTFPDYVFDKHTYRGKGLGRGVKHFVEEATKLDKDDSTEKWKKEAQEFWELEEKEKKEQSLELVAFK